MTLLVLWILGAIAVGAAWCAFALSGRLSAAEKQLARERARSSELAAGTAAAFAARRELELRVRSLLPTPLAAAILSGGDIRIAVTRLDSPEDLRRVLASVADVIPIRHNDPTKN